MTNLLLQIILMENLLTFNAYNHNAYKNALKVSFFNIF